MKRALFAFVVTCSLAAHASADRVYLKGGTVIEGKVTQLPDKVLIEVEAGQLAVPVSSVERIEPKKSPVEQVEERARVLNADDVNGLLSLANYCRDHEMPGRERELLRKVIEADPNHAEARLRLGFVHTEAGWITREQAERDKGLVKRNGQWITREHALELARLESETQKAALERDKAQAELEAKRLELRRAQREQEAQAQAQRASTGSAQSDYVLLYPPSYVVPYAPWGRPPHHPPMATPPMPPPKGPAPFNIPGVRSPNDQSFSMPGVRDPRSYF